jgi:gamma-glutamylcyclotransferase (GGCT)/AIG2-like uncharacterized protein YtfP
MTGMAEAYRGVTCWNPVVSWVFVYGTLRSGESASFDDGVAERHEAWLEDHALYGGRYPFVTREFGFRTKGELIRLDPAVAEEIMAALDRYEGDEYRRELVEVRLNDRVVSAHVWVAARSDLVADRPRVPGGDWLAR